jgi:hypothetical protein
VENFVQKILDNHKRFYATLNSLLGEENKYFKKEGRGKEK